MDYYTSFNDPAPLDGALQWTLIYDFDMRHFSSLEEAILYCSENRIHKDDCELFEERYNSDTEEWEEV